MLDQVGMFNVLCVVSALACLILLVVTRRRSADAEAARELVVARLRRELQTERAAHGVELEKLKAELDELNAVVAKVEGPVVLLEAGFAARDFAFDDPDSYQLAIKKIEEELARLIKDDLATRCSIAWEIEGSEREGEVMIKKLRRLALRTFTADADAAIASVEWNNLAAMETRIRKSEEVVEKNLDKWGVTISDEYRDLKIKELKLTHEQAELKQRIREEQRDLREQQREEEKARREAEAAEREAAREEKQALVALERARQQLSEAHDSDLARHQDRIRELEARVADAEEKRQRALSMAEQTKRGHVYIASNVGSFGPSVLKIGMTRRLDPMDRIWELSDASVPFDFDVHGLIATDDAPALESMLHERFASRRINLVNLRKEFFEVSITDLQEVVGGLGFDVRLTLAAEAREHHQSLAIRRGEAGAHVGG